MDRLVVIVVRSNGKDVEVLPFMYLTPAEARLAAQYDQERWLGVTLEVVKVAVPLQGEKVTAPPG